MISNQSRKNVETESQKDFIPEIKGTIEEEKSNEQVLDQIQMSFSESMDITQSYNGTELDLTIGKMIVNKSIVSERLGKDQRPASKYFRLTNQA